MTLANDTPTALSAAAIAQAGSRRLQRLAMGVFCIFALGLPFVASGYHLFQFAQVLIYAIALLGLNILTGYNGQISLGHGAFYAIGGYAMAILATKFDVPYWATIPVSGLICFVAGFLFGLPALRLGGLYLALATFALAVATPQLLNYRGFDAWTGGSQGLQLGKPHAPFALPLTSDQWLYFLCLVCAALMFWAAANLVRGRIGRAIIAIRDHPIAAETMGINISFYKAMCFGVSALYAGVAGALGSIVVGFISPDSFGLFLSLSFLVGIVVGGLASIWGVLFGALFIEFVPNYADQLSDLFGESAKALPGAIYGILLIGLMYLMPTGVAGVIRTAPGLLSRLFSRPKRV
ncbi:branched-chain amino acid ABC transporter permease [Methylocapsa sp. S129]|uniref:branched-chain amino acid ABC transporter permease n=1 Tax=Methylocapsa sp. S129 TaxID=1641869 RepID=UPI001AEDEEFA|nr:branched-chain amino acid ABC transporter permease [Methylocapsa sp. S129]